MTRRALRTTLVTLGLCTIAACVVNISFDMPQTVQVSSAPGVTSIHQVKSVNLQDYSEVRDHKDNIKSLDLDSLDVVVTAVDAGNHATKVTGTVVLRPSGASDATQDVKVGSLTEFPITLNNKTTFKGSPELDAFLLNQLHSEGTFSVVVDGNIDAAPAVMTLTVTMHSSLGYDTGIF